MIPLIAQKHPLAQNPLSPRLNVHWGFDRPKASSEPPQKELFMGNLTFDDA
jgi:hypothetical protein